MKIAILANPDSTHTRKWVTSLCRRGISVVLITMNDFDDSAYKDLPEFRKYTMNFSPSLNTLDRKFSKLKYLSVVGKIKTILRSEKPDILHSYYASSFGLLGALCRYHPFVISVWGSDIFDFPHSSIFAKRILKFNLSRADYIMATSKALASETSKYTGKECFITPFGVDTEKFTINKKDKIFSSGDLVIGAIKTLEKVYGLDYLIRAFAMVVKKMNETPLKLLLVGKGSCEAEYKLLVKQLGIEQNVLFAGYVDHSVIVSYYNNIDVFVVPSIRESFGVSALEASACGIPVIASDTGGLPEVVIDNVTGLIVPVKNEQAIADALEKLIMHKTLRTRLGNTGREMVVKNYNWNNCLQGMISIYDKIMSSTHNQ